MPTKGSRVRGVRIPDEVIDLIKQRAARRGWTFNKWMNYVVYLGLREHRRK